MENYELEDLALQYILYINRINNQDLKRNTIKFAVEEMLEEFDKIKEQEQENECKRN